MHTTKLMQAINGDRVTFRHSREAITNPMTAHATVRFNGVSHMVVSTPSPTAAHLAMTTAQFTVRGHAARIVERVDSNSVGQATIKYEGILEADHGALWVQSYDSPEHTVALLEALDPQDTPLGVIIGPDAEVEYAMAPEVILEIEDMALLGLAPLTKEIANELPDWAGTTVPGGELYGGQMTRSSPMLILVTGTARAYIQPNEGVDIDGLTEYCTSLQVTWSP